MAERRIVGTGEGCDVRVTDAPYMSTRHFALVLDEQGLSVEDLGSTNGTEVYVPPLGWVKAWSPVRIGPGSKVHAGRVLFKIGTDGRRIDVVKDVDAFQRDRA